MYKDIAMKRKTKSILEELTEISLDYDSHQVIENHAINTVAATSNLISLIYETYSVETAKDLEKRLINSIRTQDDKKFLRGIRRANEALPAARQATKWK
jgi:hypothetical protein